MAVILHPLACKIGLFSLQARYPRSLRENANGNLNTRQPLASKQIFLHCSVLSEMYAGMYCQRQALRSKPRM